MKNILDKFLIEGEVLSCERYGCGHINETYLVITTEKRYILQKINDRIFKDVSALMENIRAVTEHLEKKETDKNRVLRLVKTKTGESFLYEEGFYRVYHFVENSVCLQAPETAEDFYESAVAFGSFIGALSDFEASSLSETIPDFHNTPDRYRKLKEAIKADPKGRVKEVGKEIEFALSKEALAGKLWALKEAGKLPLRVTHNDTKLNNVMLSEGEKKPLCVIDLDTVMPGLSAFDFGDSIRFGANTGAEDEKDLEKIGLDISLYNTFYEGFVSAFSDLTDLEKETLPLGAFTMTIECGVRFLTDYIEGDHYFATHREGHNLDRCRTQFKLASEIEKRLL